MLMKFKFYSLPVERENTSKSRPIRKSFKKSSDLKSSKFFSLIVWQQIEFWIEKCIWKSSTCMKYSASYCQHNLKAWPINISSNRTKTLIKVSPHRFISFFRLLVQFSCVCVKVFLPRRYRLYMDIFIQYC